MQGRWEGHLALWGGKKHRLLSGVMEGGVTSRETWAQGFQGRVRPRGGWGGNTTLPPYLFVKQTFTEHLPDAKHCIRVAGGKEKIIQHQHRLAGREPTASYR